MLNDCNHLGRIAIATFTQNRTDDFVQIAKLVEKESQVKKNIKRELLQIVKGDNTFEDIQTRSSALNVLAVLGLTKDLEAHCELCNYFQETFTRSELQELAAMECRTKLKQCEPPCSKINLLKSFLRALLDIKDDQGITIASQVSDIFVDTKLGNRIAQQISGSV